MPLWKLFLIALIAVFLVTPTAYAKGSPDCDGFFGQLWNACHGVEVYKHRTEVGVGADVILYEGEEGDLLNQAHGEYRYDWQNGDSKVYAVATTKLVDVKDHVKALWKKVFGKNEGE